MSSTSKDDDPRSPTDPSQMAQDAEGVWSPDIEQSFQEAMAIYPPCGRRKIILSDEGKMYGRNELIARYIKLRTGKSRTRKQVSSHIQVLARRKAREVQTKMKDSIAKEKTLQTMASMSSSQIASASAPKLGLYDTAGTSSVIKSESCHSMTLSQQMYWPTVHPHLTSMPSPVPFPSTGMSAPYFLPPSNHLGPQVHPGQANAPSPGMGAACEDMRMMYYHTMSPVTCSSFAMMAQSHGNPWQMARPMPLPPLPLARVVELRAFVEYVGRNVDRSEVKSHNIVTITGNPLASAHMESIEAHQIYDKFPDSKGGLKDLFEAGPSCAFFLVKIWADMQFKCPDKSSARYAVSALYECTKPVTLQISTRLCSFGKQVMEKVETESAVKEAGRYMYKSERQDMCDYLISFISRLSDLPEARLMNSVLENFTIMQVFTDRDTHEVLLCLAYVFEVSTTDSGAPFHFYRLF